MSNKHTFDFDEYIRQSEPDKQRKGYIWQTAIGLQDVDGLKPSEYLLQTAKKNVDGDITIQEANELIHSYYKSKIARLDTENRTEEADKVSARIAQILSEDAFVFAIKYLRSLGFNVSNTLFAENSWYFRNALVRANYADIQKGIYEDKSFLEEFFRNLILNEQNEMKNRYLLIEADLSKKIGDKQKIGDKKSAIKQRTKRAIIDFIQSRENAKTSEIAEAINLKPSRTRDYLAEMTKEGLIEAQGANRNRVYKLKK